MSDVVEQEDDIIAGVRPREVVETDTGGEVDKVLFVSWGGGSR
jgi:hypothetical protein